jgi:biotin transport system substrate-specific component
MKQTDPKLVMNSAAVVATARPMSLPVIVNVLGCCLLVGLGAQVRIPVPGTDVPMTLQSLAVLLTGFALRPSQAVAAMLLYIFGGAAGLPLFAGGSAGVLGPTGGYIVGFLPAAWLVSVLRGGRRASYTRLLLAGAAGTAAIFALGIMWPGRIAFYGGNVSVAIITGVVPFAVKAVVQLFLAVTLVVSIRGLRGGRKRSAAL